MAFVQHVHLIEHSRRGRMTQKRQSSGDESLGLKQVAVLVVVSRRQGSKRNSVSGDRRAGDTQARNSTHTRHQHGCQQHRQPASGRQTSRRLAQPFPEPAPPSRRTSHRWLTDHPQDRQQNEQHRAGSRVDVHVEQPCRAGFSSEFLPAVDFRRGDDRQTQHTPDSKSDQNAARGL